MKRILFVASTIMSFRKKDLDILRRHFTVDVVSGKLGLSRLVDSVARVIHNDVIFCWFVNKRALFFVLLSKLLRKRSILVTGGNDIVEVPEIGYRLGVVNTLVARISLRLFDTVLAFSDSSRQSVLQLAPKAKVETVYVGAIDTEKFKPLGEKECLVITVGHVTWSNLDRKGLRAFVETAKYLPNVRFALIGEWGDDSISFLRSISVANVNFTGYLSLENLVKYYQRAKVYAQLSIHEGFGISVAEAMSCECVPVVTKIASLPEVVGDSGYYVPFKNPQATADAIKKALKDKQKCKKARKRVEEFFTLKRRERELVNVISNIA